MQNGLKFLKDKGFFMTEKKAFYPQTEPKADFPKLEEDILTFWDRENIFNKSIEQHQGKEEFVFYDGPPFANGHPHYGHILQSYSKDTIGRYQTQRGKKVNRQWGWDCHGLPPELQTEKELGISGKEEIMKYGIDKFVEKCRTDVLKYTTEWKKSVRRLGRWADMENAYKTMDTSYTESVIWAFKELYNKGLAYEGFRCLPYSWGAETPISNFEKSMPECYRDRIDDAVTVMFKLIGAEELHLLVWTTTPWTLPSNLALAVGENIDYAVMEENGKKYVLAEALRGSYAKELSTAKHIRTIKGKDLVGATYEPLFPYFKHKTDAFKVFATSFVSTEDGTGIVHLAPFGEEDFAVFEEKKIGIVCPVDEKGRFTAEVPNYHGQNVFDANKPIIKDLKEKGVLIRQENYKHSYPHCWRTDTPLIYKPISSWFVKVDDIKARMIHHNQKINWIPDHIKDGRFGKWLEGARDWSISRNRFWGAPLPVWKSDNPKYPRLDVFGSIAEIEKASKQTVKDFHRPYIDQIVYPNPDDPSGKTQMRRVEDVFDCWFESGSMPFASIHYPFENKDWFDNHFPADFIGEAIEQTRGWFYTLVVLGTALFDKAPFKNCIGTGLVFDDQKRKLSKKLQNYAEPNEIFNAYGSDAFRWFLLSSPLLKGENAYISKTGEEIQKASREALIPLWNAYHFFTIYANADGIQAKEISKQTSFILDQYILSKLNGLIAEMTEDMDHYENCFGR